jgi:RNA polymerase sigma factor (sigma-70 family)
MLSNAKYDLEIATWIIEFEKSETRKVQKQILESCQCSAIEAHKRAHMIIGKALEKIHLEKRKNKLYVSSILKKLTKYEVDSLNKHMSKNFGLSESDFKLIITQLKVNETKFFELVFTSHFADCTSFIQKNYKASYDDAYDATMDAIIEFRERLVNQKISYGNLRYLFTKMASQIYMKKAKKFQNREINESDLSEPVQAVDEDELSILNKAWDELGNNCQNLLRNHFYAKLKLSEIAEIEQKSSSSIRKQKERCMNRLKLLFTKNSKNYV